MIDTATNKVVQTVSTNPLPGAKVGSYANAISMPDPDHLLVSIGRDNAIAVYNFKGLTKKVRATADGWGYRRPAWQDGWGGTRETTATASPPARAPAPPLPAGTKSR